MLDEGSKKILSRLNEIQLYMIERGWTFPEVRLFCEFYLAASIKQGEEEEFAKHWIDFARRLKAAGIEKWFTTPEEFKKKLGYL